MALHHVTLRPVPQEELEDMEQILLEFPTLNIAYIEEAADETGAPRFFSCLLDGTCQVNADTGRRVPQYRIELPGHPILGNGKSDNQNHAIVFSRGRIIQVRRMSCE